MDTATINFLLAAALFLSVSVNVVLYLFSRAYRADADKYYRVVVNYTKLVNGCKRCHRVLHDKLKRKNATKTGL